MSRCTRCDKEITSGYVLCSRCYEQMYALIDAAVMLKEQTTQTNADKIRSMTDEELGKWICSIMSSDCCRWTCPVRHMCGFNDNGMIKWLKQPAKEE